MTHVDQTGHLSQLGKLSDIIERKLMPVLSEITGFVATIVWGNSVNSHFDSHLAVRLNDLDLTRCTEQCAILLSLLVGRGIERKKDNSVADDQRSTDERTGSWVESTQHGSLFKQDQFPEDSKNVPTLPDDGTGANRPEQVSQPREMRGHTVRRDRYEQLALNSMLGYLSDSFCRGSVVQPAEDERQNYATQGGRKTVRQSNLWQKLSSPFGTRADDQDSSFDLEFVVLPVDGVDELRLGYNGAVSLLAGGPTGSFPRKSSTDSDYFVLVISPRYAHEIDWALSQASGRRQSSSDASERVREVIDWIHQPEIQSSGNTEEESRARLEFTIGAMPSRDLQGRVIHAFHKLMSALSCSHRIRTFGGSPVAAAVTAFLPHFGIDVYVAQLDRTRAVLTATAALCTKCGFRALSCSDPASDWLKAEDFVHGDDVFLVASGITENLTLQGVRFRGDLTVSTHTMCLRSKTNSTRFVTHHHNLEEKKFRLLDAKEPLAYMEVLQEIERLATR